jgi:hypothetical protein
MRFVRTVRARIIQQFKGIKMAAWTDYAENKIVDAVFRAQPLNAPATFYVGLMTTADNDAGSARVEVSGGAYTRVAIASSLANWAGTQGSLTTTASSGTGGTTSNNITITFPAPTANWGSIVGFGLFDAVTGGNEWMYGTLTTPKTVNSGDPAPLFSASALSVQIDN